MRLGIAVCLPPRRGPSVQRRDELRLAPQQLGLEHLPEQVVIAEPHSTVVERDEQEVGRLHRLQHQRGVVPVQHGVAGDAAHAVEDGRPRQELHLLRRKSGEVLGADVVGHETVVAPERR
jgi:hypothetical protein